MPGAPGRPLGSGEPYLAPGSTLFGANAPFCLIDPPFLPSKPLACGNNQVRMLCLHSEKQILMDLKEEPFSHYWLSLHHLQIHGTIFINLIMVQYLLI